MRDNIRKSNICISGVSEEERKKVGLKEYSSKYWLQHLTNPLKARISFNLFL